MNKFIVSIIFLFIFFFSFVPPLFATSKLYISNGSDNNITVLDGESYNIISKITVENQPRKVVAYGKYIYVANMFGHSISVIDSVTDNVIATIFVGDIYPERLSISSDGKRLYTGDPFLTKVAIIDTTNKVVTKILSGFSGPHEAKENFSGTRLYVVNQNYPNENGYVSVLDTIDYSILSTIPVGGIPVAIAVAPNDAKAYVLNNGGAAQGNTVSVIDTATNTIIDTITVGVNPYAIVINSIGTRAYVMNTFYWAGQSGGTISVIDVATDSVIDTIPIGDVPNSLSISSNDNNIYVSKSLSNTMIVIDTATNTVANIIAVGSNPWGIAVSDPDTNITLDVPYFSQNDLSWGTGAYDHTSILGINGIGGSMDRWGCAVSSVAMVLKYHNINQFADGTEIDPGSLNQWLNKNDGYSYGYGKDGWYSYINWNRVGKLTQQLHQAGKAPYKLEYDFIRSNQTAETKQILENDLTVGNEYGPFPDILWVKNNQTDGHFVVAKGIENGTYAINDPEWNYSTLSSFNDDYMQVGRYIPSNTDLSYLTIVVNPDVEVLVIDKDGRRSGKYIHNGTTEVYNEIPNASYGFEGPLSNPGGGTITNLGTGVNSFLLPKPTNGNYKITLSSKEDTFYTVNISTTEEDGDYKQSIFKGSLAPNKNDESTISYVKDAPSEIKKTITFASTLEDIKELRGQKLLHSSLALSTGALVKNAEMLYKSKKYKQAKILLDVASKLIKNSPKKLVNPVGKDILIYDFKELNALLHK